MGMPATDAHVPGSAAADGYQRDGKSQNRDMTPHR
jgi:hypothetical protein